MRQPKIRNAIIMLVGGLLCTLVFLLVFQFDRGMKALLIQREQDNIKQQAQVAAAIAALRKKGETVVCVLPGHESEVDEFHCDRELVNIDGHWVVQAI